MLLLANGRLLDKKDATFARQLDVVKKAIKVLADPAAALKAKEATDRQFAAIVLVHKYRKYPRTNDSSAKVVQEPIDAEESNTIMQNLAETDWALKEIKDPATGKVLGF